MSPAASSTLSRGDGDIARWRRLVVVAIALVVLSTAGLISLMRVEPSTASPAIRTSADQASRETLSKAPGESNAAARPRVYSPVDVSTLAAARAHGEAPPATRTVTPEDVSPVVITEASTAPTAAITPSVQSTPVVAARSSPRDATPSRQAPARPVARPVADRAGVSVPHGRPAAKGMDSRVASVESPTVVERAPLRETSNEAPRPRPPDASATDLDAAWDRREQWMRERLRQR